MKGIRSLSGFTKQASDQRGVAVILERTGMPLMTAMDLERLLSEVKSKSSTSMLSKVVQRRPRCFQNDKIVKLYGTYRGPVVKGSKNGEGVFVW